jgi:hypothetical protein
MVSSPSGQKSLTSGRIVIIINKQFLTRYGMMLSKKSQFSSLDSKHGKKSYTVLLACDHNEVIWNEEQVPMVDEDSEVIVEPYACSIEVYRPQRPSTHTIVEIREEEIVVITGQVKPNLNSEAMINDFNKRKQPRFRCVIRLSKAEAATITPPTPLFVLVSIPYVVQF